VVNELEAFANRFVILRMNALTALATMNIEQQNLFFTIYNDISSHTRLFPSSPTFVEGRPGHGKTFVMNAIVNILRSEGKIVLICGTSALAASLYERGRTAHSLFEIPVTEVRHSFPALCITNNILIS
jgi:ABC-type branched-subunit amino acid transport system ATPase component